MESPRETPPAGGTIAGWFGYLVALILFVAIMGIGVYKLPPIEMHWTWLGLTALLAPATLFLNAVEYRLAGRWLGHRIAGWEAVEVTILASAANLLPLPGSVLVRVHALRKRGSRTGAAVRSSVAIGLAWLSTSFCWAGILLAFGGWMMQGTIFFAIGVGLAMALLFAIPPATRASREVGLALGLESVFVLVATGRLYATLSALGFAPVLGQAAGLAIAGALATAVGVLPGGLGLRELIAAGIGPLIEIPSATSIVASGVDRLVGVMVLSVVVSAILIRRPESSSPRELP